MKKFLTILVVLLANILFIPNVFAGTNFGKVTDINNTDSASKVGDNNPTITGNETKDVTVTYDAVNLKILGGTSDRPAGYAWLGFHIDKPTGVSPSSGKAKARYNNGEASEYSDGDYYVGINKDKLITAVKQNKNIQYVFEFDWDNNGTYDQTVTVIIAPSKITLTNNDVTEWTPADVAKYTPTTTTPPKTGDSFPFILTCILIMMTTTGLYSLKLYRK